MSVVRQNAILLLASYIICAGFSLLQCPTKQAMPVTPGFPCLTFPRPMLLRTAGFSMHGVFHDQPVLKNIASVGRYLYC